MKPLKSLLIGGLLLVCLSVSAMALSEGGVVTASALNLRAEPATTAAVLTVAPKNSPVILLEEQSGWYKVSYSGRTGYMSADYIQKTNPVEGSFGTGFVLGTQVRMRAFPDTDSEILNTYDGGTAAQVLGIDSGWYKVTIDGETGYIRSDFLTLDGATTGGNTGGELLSIRDVIARVETGGDPGDYGDGGLDDTGVVDEAPADTSAGQAIVDTAMQYLGVPYVYGGASPSGFDCSGFVYYVYGQHGYTLNRTAADQAKNGVAVEKSDLQPGDIVYFSNGGGGSIGHSGLYIGDGMMIHASSGGGSVITTDLSSDYYTRYYAGARRIV